MKKVIVIGCPGSGKSTFSKALHEITSLPLFHLDMMFWNADRTRVDRSVFLERLSTALQGDAWIIDGNYASTMEARMQACDTVVFLDYPPEVCLSGIRERLGTTRSDIPWVETQEDAEFVAYVQSFHTQGRPQILELLARYPQKNLFRFRSRSEGAAFLAQLQPPTSANRGNFFLKYT